MSKMQREKRHRSTALLLGFCMLFSLGAVTVYATGSGEGATGYALSDDREYIAYDNGTEDGEAVESDGTTEAIPAAETKFTVTLPAGTEFYYVNPNGTQGDKVDDATALTLKVQQYTKDTVDADGDPFDYEYHEKQIDEHMNWHTGVDDSTNDVQFWRVWFEEAVSDSEGSDEGNNGDANEGDTSEGNSAVNASNANDENGDEGESENENENAEDAYESDSSDDGVNGSADTGDGGEDNGIVSNNAADDTSSDADDGDNGENAGGSNSSDANENAKNGAGETSDGRANTLSANAETGGREVEVVIPKGERAIVVVDYLDPDSNNSYPGALKGDLGTRRICVMDMGNPGETVPSAFTDTDEYALAASSEPGELEVEDTCYTKVTYYVEPDEKGNSPWGNLTALCSMKLANTYVSNTSMIKIQDGLSAFDAEEKDGSGDKQGNDSSDSNRRVRTFDTINYTLNSTFAARSQTTTTDSVVAMLRAELPMDVTKARFDTGRLSTNYTLDNKAAWEIVYYNEEDTALYIEDPDGLWKCDGNGNKTDTKTTLNDIANGSNSSTDGGAYATKVVRQELTAYKEIEFTGSAATGQDQFPVFVNVTAAQNGDTVEPSFAVSIRGNKDNFTSEQNDNGEPVVSAMEYANRHEIRAAGSDGDDDEGSNAGEVITVTAAPRYNVVIKQSSDTQYSGYFNFDTGVGADSKEGAGEGNVVNGMLTAYGITVQLFNETNWTTTTTTEEGKTETVVDTTKLAAKGMMGIELPTDSITFDMQLSGAPVQEGDYTDDAFALMLWDWQESQDTSAVKANGDKGEWGRNLYWKNADVTRYAKGATVFNGSGKANHANNEVYRGGDWSLAASDDGIGTNGHTTGSTTGNGSATHYTFTVENFDFDLDNLTKSFPTYTIGSSAPADWLTPGYVGSIAAAHIQVVQRIPEEIDMDATVYAKALVADKVNYEDDDEDTTHFGATSLSSSATKEAQASKATGDGMGGTADDGKQISLQVYAPGTMNKHNSFTSRKGTSIGSGFLGTSYWNNGHYDASVYAGSKIYLWGGAQLSRTSEAVVSAYNLLQKFDSSKLEIDETVSAKERLLYTDVNGDSAWPVENWNTVNKNAETMTTANTLPAAGKATFFYAADPLYPNGWNADVESEMERMNSADEKDLIYYTDLDELENDGYTCIGILLEVRNAEIPAGCYPGMRVAMTVKTQLDDANSAENGKSTVNMVACTVNTARMWGRKLTEEKNLVSDVTWESTVENNPSASAFATSGEIAFENKLTDTDNTDLWKKWFGGENEDTGTVNKNLKEEHGDNTTARYITCGKNDGTNTKGSYNNFPYVKTAYKDGMQVSGTHLGGFSAGMSLQILGYTASLNIGVTNEVTNKQGTVEQSEIFSPNKNGQSTPLFTITDIKATLSDSHGTESDSVTNLTVTAQVKNDNDPMEIIQGGYQVQSLVDGELTWIDVSSDENNPTSVTLRDDEKQETYTYKVYAEISGDGLLKFYLIGAPIEKTLASLRFSAAIGSAAENTDDYDVVATISGDGDERAYSEKNGNQVEATVVINKTGGAALIKAIEAEYTDPDTESTYIEQNGEITYTVSYENQSSDPMSEKLYLYDLLPYNRDNRLTNYTRDEDVTQTSDAFTVEKVSASLTGATGTPTTKSYVYYSTIIPTVLENYVEFADTGSDTYPDAESDKGEDLDQLLSNALIANDGNGIWYVVQKDDEKHTPVNVYTYDETTGAVTGVNSNAVEYKTNEAYGQVTVRENYLFYNPRLGITADYDGTTSDGSTLNILDGTGKFTCYKMFRWLGVMDFSNGSGELDTSANSAAANLKYATCLYGVTTDLAANATLTVGATVKTDGNEAADFYANTADAWKTETARDGDALTSNLVKTYVVGREISGLVWEDVDHSGTQNTVGGEAEPLIEGVTCTLFRWDEGSNMYVPVKANDGPNGRLISATYQDGVDADGNPNMVIKEFNQADESDEYEIVQITTGADGSYCFSDLAEGDYVVAFSGNALKEYVGETKYQVSGANDDTGNDGVANGENDDGDVLYSGISAEEYAYCIQYSTEKANVTMHGLAHLASNKNLLTNSVERVAHQDLGLIIDRYELPETGGSGGIFYRLAGILLILAAAGGWWNLRKEKWRNHIMKKSMRRRISAVCMTAVLLLGMTVIGIPAQTTVQAADSPKGTVTVNNAIAGETYTIYQVLKLEDDDYPSKGTYLYKTADGWDDFITDDDSGGKYLEKDHNDYVIWKDGIGQDEANKKGFAVAALEYADTNSITNVGNATAAKSGDDVTVTFTDLSLGYYVLVSSAGTNPVSFNVDKEAVTVNEKNKAPTIEKKIVEGDDKKDENSANIGDMVEFQTTITVAAGARNYVLHDKMDAGLTFDVSTGVTSVGLISSDDDTEESVETTNYTVAVGDETSNACTFHVTFEQNWLNTLSAGNQIIVHYQATLNDQATTGSDPNDNNTWLKYGNNSETTHDTTETYTYKFQIVKTDGGEADGNTYEVLDDAEFKLYRGTSIEDKSLVYFTSSTVDNVTTYVVASSDAEGAAAMITAGTPIVQGLEEGTYMLVETKAPEGYNKAENTEITISKDKGDNVVADGKLVVGAENKLIYTDSDTSGGVHVINHSGATLPTTGGMGTTILYVAGAVLILGAGAGLIWMNRRGGKKGRERR